MAHWLAWLIAAGVLAVGEMLTLVIVLGPLALAAGATAIAASLGIGLAGELIVFIATSLASLLVLRPIARRHLRMPARIRTGVDALTGQQAVVTERVDQHGGRIRIGGEVWSARALEGAGIFEPGASVIVAEISGATAIVMD